ncbi:MAG: LysR family transcriptional regulator [Pseudomonadota bacterium]
MAHLNYAHLRYFREVAHEGNLTRAAARLNVAASALSVQIQKLEAQLGQALFERRGKQLVLTEAGRIALDRADAIFRTGNELVATLRERGGAARQVVRVGALATLSRNFQLTFLAPLLGAPDVELVLRSGGLGDLLRRLEALQLDVVLTDTLPQRDAASPWIARAIAEQPVSLVGTPARLALRRSLEALLAEEPLLLPSAETGIRRDFDALVDRLGVRCRIAAEVDDMAMLRLLARADAGLAVVPPIVVADELASGSLVEAARLPDLREGFFALTLERRFPNPLLRELLARRPEGSSAPLEAG